MPQTCEPDKDNTTSQRDTKMKLKSLLAGAFVLGLSLPVAAMDALIVIDDAYARTSRPNAPTGAAFMMLRNHAGEDDRLIAVASDVAERVELHTHLEDANGVMRMVEFEDGIAIPAGGTHALARGGDHVMFMGLKRDLVQGETITVTLTFENAGAMTVDIPIDNERKADGHGAHESHGGHGDHHGTHATN